MKYTLYIVITTVLLSFHFTQVFSLHLRDYNPPSIKSSERSCTDEYEPVCTAKQVISTQCIGSANCIRTINTTYDNSCLAHKAWAEITSIGVCGSPDSILVRRSCGFENVPVCWINGQTYQNACLAGDVKILHTSECENNVNSEIINNIKERYESRFQLALSEIDFVKRTEVVNIINERIEAINNSWVSRNTKERQITYLVFFRSIFYSAPYIESK